VVEVLPQLTAFKRVALDLLFPQKCIGCGKEGDILCLDCVESLPRIIPPVCPRCGKPQASEIVCPNCINQKYIIDGIRAPYIFKGIIREAIHEFKYKNIRCLAKPLALLLSQYISQNPISAGVIIPVPLHIKRLRERGYNQSDLLTKYLSKFTGIPYENHCLTRVKYILPQAKTKSVEERHKNLSDAFDCIQNGVKNNNVLLIDDVSTSGATLEACARALKSAGAVSVWGLVLARDYNGIR
jgi:ComF family protein